MANRLSCRGKRQFNYNGEWRGIASQFAAFLPGGQGRFRFLPLGPLATPVTPLKRSLREGYGTVRRACTAPKGATACGGAGGVSRLRGNSKTSWHLRAVPLSSAHFIRSHERWLEYGRLAALPLAILPIPPDSPLAASPTGRARLESPASGDSFWIAIVITAHKKPGTASAVPGCVCQCITAYR